MKRLPPRWASPSFSPDVEIELIAAPASAQILEGKPTNVWRYAARLVKGPEGTLTRLNNSYLAELIRLRTGQKLRITLRNRTPEPNIAHWHGLHAPAEMDGHPAYALDPGKSYVYEFEIRNRAGFYFFHPHTHEATATQVYRGLAGGIIVNDAEEDALGLPSGEYELPIVLQDRSFNDENQLIYDVGMHERMIGFQGERILVNGKADYAQDVASRAYRLRILNASNARIYKLSWDDGSPIVVLGVDGGLLAAPETKPYVMLAPGERLDVWADFSGRKIGETIVMRSAPFAGAAPAMATRMQRMMGGSGLPAGGAFPLFALRVARETSESPELPKRLLKPPFPSIEEAANPQRPAADLHQRNADGDADQRAALQFRRCAGDREDPPQHAAALRDFPSARRHGPHGHARGNGGWDGGGMGGMGMGGMMSMAHPIHLHGQQFVVLSRDPEMVDEEAYATVKDGFVMSGLKDTVAVFSGERVRILKPFDDYAGRFMYHCHNLEHEDMGMMREFVVG